MTFPLAVALFALGLAQATAALLTDPLPVTCHALDGHINKGGAGIEAFNEGKAASIAAFQAGHHDEGCRLFLSVWHWTDRVIAQLDTCAAASPIQDESPQARMFQTLRAGYEDLRLQLVRVDEREACGPRSRDLDPLTHAGPYGSPHVIPFLDGPIDRQARDPLDPTIRRRSATLFIFA